MIAHHERDARIAERVDACADGELCRAVERAQALRRDAELGPRVEGPAARRELEHVALALDRLEAGAVVALHEARDVLVEDRMPAARRDHVDQLLAVEEPADVVVVEDVFGAGEPERRAGDDHRRLRRHPGAAGQEPGRALEELDGEPSERALVIGVAGGRNDRSPRRGRRRRGNRRDRGDAAAATTSAAAAVLRGAAHPEPGGVEPAQRLVDRDQVGHLRVVRVERHDVGPAAEDVVGESLERPLRPHLDEDARPRGVERLEPLHELHRRGDLPREDVEHRGVCARPDGVELAAHVGDDRQRRRLEPEPAEDVAERLARRRHDAGVEGVAHRQGNGRVSGRLHRGDGALDGRRRAADHALLRAVHVGDDDVAVDAGDEGARPRRAAPSRRPWRRSPRS